MHLQLRPHAGSAQRIEEDPQPLAAGRLHRGQIAVTGPHQVALSDASKQQVIALSRLGWTLRHIEAATGVRRETASAYLKAAGLAVRPPGRWGHAPARPAIGVSTDPGPPAAAAEPSTPI